MLTILLAALLTLTDAGPGTLAPEPQPQVIEGIGVGIPHQNEDEERVLEILNPPIWTNWVYNYIGYPGYLPMLWKVDKDSSGSDISNWDNAVVAAQTYPEQLWLLGNEPEWPQQSNTEPDIFAESVREWQKLTNNPIACCGIYVSEHIAWQPWMYWYLHHNGPIPEYWQIHVYGGTPGMWERSYDEFVWWMELNNVERPIIVSEMSAAQYPQWMHVWIMSEVPKWLVTKPYFQAAMWYASEDPFDNFDQGDLLNEDYTLTEVGEAYIKARDTEYSLLYMPHIEK